MTRFLAWKSWNVRTVNRIGSIISGSGWLSERIDFWYTANKKIVDRFDQALTEASAFIEGELEKRDAGHSVKH